MHGCSDGISDNSILADRVIHVDFRNYYNPYLVANESFAKTGLFL